jgi:hypothetical protein
MSMCSGLPRKFFLAVTTGIFFFLGGGQQIQLRTEGRENGVLDEVAPYSGVPLNLQMTKTRILIRLLRIYFPRNWEFGAALPKLRNFGGLLNTSKPPRYSNFKESIHPVFMLNKPFKIPTVQSL